MDSTETVLDRDFLMKEVEHLRKNYDEFIEETRRLERYAIVVTGATWSWCAANTHNYAFGLLVWFPAFACALFGLRAAAIHYQSRAVRQYIANVEATFQLPAQLGWAGVQIQHSTGVPALVAVTAYIFWATVSLGTIAIPLIFRAHGLG